MRTQVLVLLMMGLLATALVGAGVADAADPRGTPKCAIMNPVPDVITIGTGPDRYIGAEFHNRCMHAVTEMGVFACLEELDGPWTTPRVVECFVERDKPVFVAPHTTSVYMAATCNYTDVRRWYQISGYGWAVSLARIPYRSNEVRSRKWTTPATGSKGVNLQCDIPGRHAVKWRDEPWWPGLQG